jgi:antitoxin component YwqK of YwqJK toxin-antitoxin module
MFFLLSRSLIVAVGVWFAPCSYAQGLPGDTPPVNSYYSNGMLRQQIEQTRTRRTERSYYPSGVMQQETVFAMDGDKAVRERDVMFAPTGVMLREQRWLAGEPLLDIEFLTTGVLRSKREYSGLGMTRELRVQTYYASGVLATEERYAAPSGTQKLFPIGIQKTFDTSGRPQEEKIYDLSGKLVSERQWSVTGELLSIPSTTRP